MNIGDQLPSLELATADGRALRLRAPVEGPTVLLFVPSTLRGDPPYTRAFTDASELLRQWDARGLLVSASRRESVRDGSPIAIVLDRNGDLRRRVGVEEGSWALLIADRWGVLYDVVQTEDVDDLPDLDDIDAWLKFLATQCPECGVIDEPTSPEWGVP